MRRSLLATYVPFPFLPSLPRDAAFVSGGSIIQAGLSGLSSGGSDGSGSVHTLGHIVINPSFTTPLCGRSDLLCLQSDGYFPVCIPSNENREMCITPASIVARQNAE